MTFKHPLAYLSFLGVGLIGGMALWQSHQPSSFVSINADLCQQRALIDTALSHGVGYEIIDDFDMPAIKITANKETLKLIQNSYDNTNTLNQQCHLINAKYSVKNINTKLISHIPDNADYVSYSPFDNKAIYCHYQNNGSQCHFIHLKEQFGTAWLIRDDISQLEQINLTTNNINKDQEIYRAYSYVDKWHNKPHLLYGISFMTNVNGNRWGAGGIY